MLSNDLTTYRRSGEPELCEALERREALALAEACSRTLPAAYAVARRFLPSTDVDALLLAVYTELWESPPEDVPLERWVRARCSAIALSELRGRGAAPATPSVRTVAQDLPEPSLPYVDTTERTLAGLDDQARHALLWAHDLGIPSTEQDAPESGLALVRALRALADPDGADPDSAEDAVADAGIDGRLADWVLGLLPPGEAAALERGIADDPTASARMQLLRRGRRRIEGLPPAPDLGPRLVAAVLSATPGQPPATARTEPAPPQDAGEPRSTQVDDAETRVAGAPRDDALLDTGWQPPDTGVDEGPAFDDTPPGGVPVASAPPSASDAPVADSALDAEPETDDQGLRLSDLFDDADDDDDTMAVAFGTAHDDRGEPSEDAPARDLEAESPDHLADDDPFAGLRGAEADHDEDLWASEEQGDVPEDDPRFEDEEERSTSVGRRILQVIGLLLLLGAAVGIGLLIGQVGVNTLQR